MDITTDADTIARDTDTAKRFVDNFIRIERDDIIENDGEDIGGILETFCDDRAIEGDYDAGGAFWGNIATYFQSQIDAVLESGK